MKRARSFLSACLFLCGVLSFCSLPWIQRIQLETFLRAEPFYRCPVVVYSDRALIRNDSFGKGRFGASRGSRGQRSHQGVDLLSGVGNPIMAAKSGRVRFAGIDKGYGWYVELLHFDGRISRYAHLSRLFTSTGDWVLSGQKIGTCGKSGNADDPRIQPHLHFEIREKDKSSDPLKQLDPGLKII